MVSLKVVHVSTSYNGGAGRAAVRLHKALLKRGVESTLLFLEKDLPEDLINAYSISIPEYTFLDWQKLRIKHRLHKHFGINIYNEHERISHELAMNLPNLQCEITTLPFSYCNILEHPEVKNADIIHLHWVSGMLDYPSFFEDNSTPVIWTLHDKNPFSGLFHYKEDKLRNQEIIEEFDNKITSIKAKAVKNRKSKLTVISPSEWLLSDALESKVLKNVDALCIPNPIDADLFSPQLDIDFRKQNNIPEQNIILLFIAQLVNIQPKGFNILIEALKQLRDIPITLLVLGESSDLHIEGLDIRKLGTVNDEIILRNYYSAADAFVTPSTDENLPYVMLESLCCGTPVIGFSIGGIKENIVNYENGILADSLNSESLAKAIEDFYKNRAVFNSEKISKKAGIKYNEHLISQKYINVYKTTLSN